MIRRTSLLTPISRRRSTPARPLCRAQSESQHSQQQPNDHIIDGRVQRRLHRDTIRTLVTKITGEKNRDSRAAKARISKLEEELKARDREIYELQNATVIIDTERIWDLEKQVVDLQREVELRTAAAAIAGGNHDDDAETVAIEEGDGDFDWTVAAKDPFEDGFMNVDDDDVFGDTTMGQFICGTPSRARESFPTPPATSPTGPRTPSSRYDCLLRTPTSHVAVQTSFTDVSERKRLAEEVESLKLEMTKLTGTLDSYKSLTARLTTQLASGEQTSSAETADLETRVGDLLRSVEDRKAAMEHLSASITTLGFPGSDASEMLTSLTTGFRAARLELEYLTPGEIALPLTSHGAEVLDLLLSNLRSLATKVKEDEATVDEYHSIEQSLRKQLDARVDVMDGLKSEMRKAEGMMSARDKRIQELEVGNERLKGAVSSYLRDISELEKLVETMEEQAATQTETHEEALAAKTWLTEELETKFSAATKRAEDLSGQVSKLNRQHGKALALRDARVSELRAEIDLVNESLRAAHETIRCLRVDNGGLDREGKEARDALEKVKGELQRVMETNLATPEKQKPKPFTNEKRKSVDRGEEMPSSPVAKGTVVEGGLLAGELARRGSKKARRRYDSGVGFLDEDELDV